MKRILKFNHLEQELLQPLTQLQQQLGFTLAGEEETGYEVTVKSGSQGLKVLVQKDKAELTYQRKSEFFRALGLMIEAMDGELPAEINEIPSFQHLTYMQDNSRNAVSNIDSIKKLIRQLALMGYDSLMLYTEDTYEIEGYPYFGYMRGRYSKEELGLLNSYAGMYGIELVPCIQTLAHLNAIFRWDAFEDIRDVNDILLCKNEKTYELIEAMVKTYSEVFSSRRINIGMDEAEMLGLGNYLRENGYTERSTIMKEHLNRVVEICSRYGYEVMMWSDMFFKMLPDSSDYRNLTAEIPDYIKESIPKNVRLIYWDYGTDDKSAYDKMLERHLMLTDRIGFAGGARKWEGFAPLLHHSMFVSKLALRSCIERKIPDVIVTGWGDNGAECAGFVVGPVLQLYAEACYNGNNSEEYIAGRLRTCTNMEFNDVMELDSLNFTPDNPAPGRDCAAPAKYVFFQDILQGLYDKHIDELTYPQHYSLCYRKLSEIAGRENEYQYIYDAAAKLAHVLELKCDMGIRLKKAYDSNDRKQLEKIADTECPELLRRIEAFHDAFRAQWYRENKAFGFDVQDIRIGGLKERVRAVTWRVKNYLNGTINRIEELEQERLLVDSSENPGYRTLPLNYNNWIRIVTASVL